MESNKPFFRVYFGRQHSGKSYDLQRFVEQCNRSTIFVYNSGWDKDWTNFIEIELWSDKKTNTLYFTYKNKDYEFATHYMKKFRGKKVKAPEADEYLTETLLFKQIKVKGRYSGLFFIMDDATNIFRLFPGRTNIPHNGFKSGRDIEFDNDDLAAIEKSFAFQLQ